MSKLAKAINYQVTGNVSALSNFDYQYTDISFHTQKVNFAKEYKIEVKISASKWFHDHMLIQSNENESAIRNEILSTVKRAMIEEVFGEFRPIIIEMQSAVFDKNQNRIRTLLAELEHKMFVEGL